MRKPGGGGKEEKVESSHSVRLTLLPPSLPSAKKLQASGEEAKLVDLRTDR